MDGQKFQDTHPDWQPGFVSPWFEFLRQRHRKFFYFTSHINLTGVLAIEKRHRRASLWAQPFSSETDAVKNLAAITPNPATVPIPQPQSSPAVVNPQFQTNPATVPSPQPQSSPAVVTPQFQTNPATVPGPQPQSSHVDPTINTTTSGSPPSQFTMENLLGPLNDATLQCQPTTVNSSAWQFPTDVTSPFYFPTAQQSEAAQPPRPDSPMTQFLKTMSPVDLYAWDTNNSMPVSTSSGSFDFSGMNFSGPASSDFSGMNQFWHLNTSGTSLLDTSHTTAPITKNPTPIPDTVDTSLYTAQSAPPPISASQNNAMSSSTHGLILPNTGSSYSVLNTAMNTIPSATSQQGNDKKRKTYEEQNSHCILPEGSHRSRKARRTENAAEENVSGPKKRNANKGKGIRGKK